MPTHTPEYLTTAEVADTLRITPWQALNLCRAGKIRAFKPSGKWLILPADLDAYIAASTNQPTELSA